MGGETGGVYMRYAEDAWMLLLPSCWNEDDDDVQARVVWNAGYVGEMLKRMFLWW